MGKRNELGMDLFNAAYQGVYELEYKGVLNKHLGLIFTAGFYGSKKDYEGDELLVSEDEPLSSRTTGSTFGVGVGNNLSRLGMAYPIGYCMSYGYKASFLTIEDEYQNVGDPVRFEQTVHEIYVRFERNYNVYEGFNIQLSVRGGTMFRKVEAETGNPKEMEETSPLRTLPAKHPFSIEATEQFRSFPTDELVSNFFVMPMVRVSYLF